MSSDICFLITILYGDTILKCAIKLDRDRLEGDIAECPMEPENREKLHAMLPLHVRACGPIVDISTELFDVVVYT